MAPGYHNSFEINRSTQFYAIQVITDSNHAEFTVYEKYSKKQLFEAMKNKFQTISKSSENAVCEGDHWDRRADQNQMVQ